MSDGGKLNCRQEKEKKRLFRSGNANIVVRGGEFRIPNSKQQKQAEVQRKLKSAPSGTQAVRQIDEIVHLGGSRVNELGANHSRSLTGLNPASRGSLVVRVVKL